MLRHRVILIVVVCTALAGGAGCERKDSSKTETIRLATTTSTVNSGLLDVLLPVFEKRTGIEVHVLPMGTGKALRTARDGNCDMVLVHAPAAEFEFVAAGWGVDRTPVMYNDFVILGPPVDPASVRGMGSAAEALKKIAAEKAMFVSRGDDSGTHTKEMELWRAAELDPAGRWYRSVGRGMGETLTMADQMRGYVLADRGTALKFRRKMELLVLVEGDEALHNPYSVIAVNPAKHPHVNNAAAKKFVEFLTSDEGRTLIADYRLEGERLFHPWPKPTGESTTP